jgi:hypothetical protein
MTIRELTSDSLKQECAKCGAIRDLNLTEITVGVEREGQVDDAIMPLPPCSNCGAVEYLIRSPMDEPAHPSPGSFGHRHRLLTDKLHAHLVALGQLVEGCSAEDAPTTKEPDDAELSRWFKDGLKLERPRENGADGVIVDDLTEPTPEDSNAK